MTESHFVDLLWDQIKNIDNKSIILFWGANKTTEELIDRIILKDNLQVCGIVDTKKAIVGTKIKNHTIVSPDSLKEIQFDILIISLDAEKENALRDFKKVDNRKPKVIIAGIRHMDFHEPLYIETLKTSLIPPRAFGYSNMLKHMYQMLQYIAKNNLKGNIAEFGVYRGGTTVFLARIAQSLGIKSKIFAFDTFQGFPKSSSVFDMYDDPHDEFFDFDEVQQYCKPYKVKMIKGDINETFHNLKDIPLILSFFDTDNYSPTKNALKLCYEQTVRGGIIAFDHYYCDERWIYTLGERMAASEFFKDKNVINLYGTGIFIKME